MRISATEWFETAKYWKVQYDRTRNISDLKNGLIAINDACDLEPWNRQYADFRLKLETTFRSHS